MADDLTLAQLEVAWAAAAPVFDKLDEATILYERPGCRIFIEPDWGPPVPYPATEREASTNHGYRPTKGNSAAIRAIPEVQGWQDYVDLLLAINHPAGPYESVGCDGGTFPSDQGGEAKVYVGTYTDIICSEDAANTPSSHLALALEMERALRGNLAWWGVVEIGIQRLKHLADVEEPWGTWLKLGQYAPDEALGRQSWGYSASLLERMFYRMAGLTEPTTE